MDRILIIRRLGKNYYDNDNVHDVLVIITMTIMMTMVTMEMMTRMA